jgi:hypothetical protein
MAIVFSQVPCAPMELWVAGFVMVFFIQVGQSQRHPVLRLRSVSDERACVPALRPGLTRRGPSRLGIHHAIESCRDHRQTLSAHDCICLPGRSCCLIADVASVTQLGPGGKTERALDENRATGLRRVQQADDNAPSVRHLE